MLVSLLPVWTLTVGACDAESTELDTRDGAADVTVDVDPVAGTAAAVVAGLGVAGDSRASG